jgi:hypothetical protein
MDWTGDAPCSVLIMRERFTSHRVEHPTTTTTSSKVAFGLGKYMIPNVRRATASSRPKSVLLNVSILEVGTIPIAARYVSALFREKKVAWSWLDTCLGLKTGPSSEQKPEKHKTWSEARRLPAFADSPPLPFLGKLLVAPSS